MSGDMGDPEEYSDGTAGLSRLLDEAHAKGMSTAAYRRSLSDREGEEAFREQLREMQAADATYPDMAGPGLTEEQYASLPRMAAEKIGPPLSRAAAEAQLAAYRRTGGLRRRPSVAQLRESAALLLAQAALIEARPKEPVSGVAVFDKRFDNEREGSKPYRYAAVKAGGGWWLTGRGGPQGGCWEDVLDFIYDRSETVTFYAVEITQLP